MPSSCHLYGEIAQTGVVALCTKLSHKYSSNPNQMTGICVVYFFTVCLDGTVLQKYHNILSLNQSTVGNVYNEKHPNAILMSQVPPPLPTLAGNGVERSRGVVLMR
jgi:hypothetical protein